MPESLPAFLIVYLFVLLGYISHPTKSNIFPFNLSPIASLDHFLPWQHCCQHILAFLSFRLFCLPLDNFNNLLLLFPILWIPGNPLYPTEDVSGHGYFRTWNLGIFPLLHRESISTLQGARTPNLDTNIRVCLSNSSQLQVQV